MWFAIAMAAAAVLSCLGVRGWGPLHWWLPRDGEPEAVLLLLQRAWQQRQHAGCSVPRAPLLLAALLRCGSELMPLGGAVPDPARTLPAYRHRLVCRPGEPLLHLRSWDCRSAPCRWHGCGRERRLDARLLSQAAAGGGGPGGWAPWPLDPAAALWSLPDGWPL